MSQEELLSQQMIGIMVTRLQSLTDIASKRRSALTCDLKGDLSGSTKTLPKLEDPYKIPATLRNKMRMTASSQLVHHDMLERLFGADETKIKQHEKNAMRMNAQKHELRRNARVQLEKHLQNTMEGHVTRTVESYHYSDNDRGAIEFDTKLFLRYVSKRIVIRKGKKAFHRFLLSDLSCKIFENVFWFCFCHYFQPDSEKEQLRLGQEMSACYVQVFGVLRSTMDEVFQWYPYAVASGVCWALHYLFPGSRQLYTYECKDKIYRFVCRILLGFELSTISIRFARKQLFPDERMESVERLETRRKMGKVSSMEISAANTFAVAEALDDVMLVTRSRAAKAAFRPHTTDALPSRLGHSASEKSFFRPCMNDATIHEIIASPGNEQIDSPVDSRMKHDRALFNASQLSLLVRNYLEQPHKTICKSCYITRTTSSEKLVDARCMTLYSMSLQFSCVRA